MSTGPAPATATTAATGAAAHDADQRLPAILCHSATIATPTAIERLLSVRDRYAALKEHTPEVRLDGLRLDGVRLTWTFSAATLRRSPADGDLWSGGPRIAF